MNEASRTRRMCAAATAALVAALLTLVTAFAVAGAPVRHAPADPAPSRAAAVAAAHHTGPLADDACLTTCTARARALRTPLGERTTPPGDLAILPLSTSAVRAQPPRAPPSSEHPPLTTRHTPCDRGRAPPAPSSI
ncbi:hypothetical protein [Streptomyces colonosanans]|uniref:Uncharacterized protein n=1 Tax=Streptomyces colonosanans TaxID=1428652 RepID=A0A1S2P4S0_9ACTN|nr:hypothetical protein [Streptomyces colonosanans]OIJ88502.1 hypothetical protein BIV24_21645 [Streptomyces colonosanans]